MEEDKLCIRYETLRNDFLAAKRKLDSKNEALLILTKDLDDCRREKDQYKLMADQLRSRCQALKKQLSGETVAGNALGSQSETCNAVSAYLELDSVRQKLSDAEGDIKILREKMIKQQLGTSEQESQRRTFAAHEREQLVQELEKSQDAYAQLELDMKQLFDEREEMVTERDSYKTKFYRLNEEVNFILRGDEKHVVDIDALIMDNKFLQQKIKQVEEEKAMILATVNKYKHILEKRKDSSILKTNSSSTVGSLISQRQVKQLLALPLSSLQPSAQVVQQLRDVIATLLETITDKNLALSHQRKSNKLLGTRITDLENKLRHMESNSPQGRLHLKELQGDCISLRQLIPHLSIDSDIVDGCDLLAGNDDTCGLQTERDPENILDALKEAQQHIPDTFTSLLIADPSDDSIAGRISTANDALVGLSAHTGTTPNIKRVPEMNNHITVPSTYISRNHERQEDSAMSLNASGQASYNSELPATSGKAAGAHSLEHYHKKYESRPKMVTFQEVSS